MPSHRYKEHGAMRTSVASKHVQKRLAFCSVPNTISVSKRVLCCAELYDAVTGILGAPLVQAFMAVRASELSWYNGFLGTPAEIVDQAAAQLFDRY